MSEGTRGYASTGVQWRRVVGRGAEAVSHLAKVSHLRLASLLLLSILVVGCENAQESVRSEAPLQTPAAASEAVNLVAPAGGDGKFVAKNSVHRAPLETDFQRSQEEASERCRLRIAEVKKGPSLPGAPQLEKQRELVMARAKAEPVVFVREPKFVEPTSKGLEAFRKRLLTSPYPRDTALEYAKRFRALVPMGRYVFLREGYFYTDHPGAARVLSKGIKLRHLFTEADLWIERGSQRFTVKKDPNIGYVYTSGPEKGQQAQLYLFDRVGVKGQDYGPPLHLDVRELAHRQGVDQMKIEHLGIDHVVADLRYEDQWVKTLLSRDGAKLEVDCQWVEPERRAEVGRARDISYRRAAVMRSLRRAILKQVQTKLPFDEPKTEVGQQDGELRRRWYQAYIGGKKRYRFNGDQYEVFDKQGNPLVPQVCIDFITETMERASGMHFRPRGEELGLQKGAIDFGAILEGSRRSEKVLRDFARDNPERFTIKNWYLGDWVKYEKVWAFFRWIRERKEEFRPGDIVIIRGRAPWDHYREEHTHTFFVYESDPVTGMPMRLAGNSGRPRIIGWDDEMLRAPKRSIRHRIRPNSEWLYDHLVLSEPAQDERWAPPLDFSVPM